MTEIVVALIGLVGVLLAAVIGPILLDKMKSRRKEPQSEQSPFEAKWLAYIDGLADEIERERGDRIKAQLDLAEVRVQLEYERRAHDVDRETIARLRVRIDELENKVNRGGTDD